MSEIILILLILNFIHGIGTWKLYKISGNSAFHSFIPLYNVFVLLKIINRPWWWIFIVLMPVLNTIIIPVIWVELSRSFKKNSYTDTFSASPFFIPNTYDANGITADNTTANTMNNTIAEYSNIFIVNRIRT